MGWIVSESSLTTDSKTELTPEIKNNLVLFYLEVTRFCKACQLSPLPLQVIAGIAGNIMLESTFNPGVIESNGIGHGLIQWTPDPLGNPNPLMIYFCKNKLGNESLWNKCCNVKITDTVTDSAIIIPNMLIQTLLILLEGFNNNDLSKVKIKVNTSENPSIETWKTVKHVGGYWQNKDYGPWSTFCKLNNVESATIHYLYCRENPKQKYAREGLRKQAAVNCFNYLNTAIFDGKLLDGALLEESFVPRLDNKAKIYDNPYWITNLTDNGKTQGGKNACYHRKRTVPTDWTKYKPVDGWVGAGTKYEYTTVLPNCTGYAYGRAMEILGGATPALSASDAGGWAAACKAYKVDRSPSLGAVICWSKPGHAGHVAVVEAINDGKITFSQSGFQATKCGLNGYNIVNDIPENNIDGWSGFTLEGYIHLPCAAADPGLSLLKFPRPRILKITDTTVTIAANAFGNNYFSTLEYVINKSSETSDEMTNKKEVKNLAECYQKISNAYVFSINKLEPLTNYSFFLTAVDEKSGSILTSDTISFTTTQSWPEAVPNVILKSLTEKKQINNTFKATFDQANNWGYWYNEKNNEKGYTLYFIVNGKTVKTEEISKNEIEFIPNEYYSKIKPGDILQIGISSWVKDSDDNKIYNQFSYKTSPAIQLLENDFEVYLMHPTKK